MSWVSTAKVGDKITPGPSGITVSPLYILAGCAVPVQGEVYTIRAIMECEGGHVGVYLKEIDNSHVSLPLGIKLELAYGLFDFRPVKSTDTGMEILRRLLKPNRQKMIERLRKQREEELQ